MEVILYHPIPIMPESIEAARRANWRLRWSPNHPVLSHLLRILAELRSIRRREGDGAHSEWSARLDNVWLVRWLQRLDARCFPVIHDEGAVVQLCDAGVKLAQEFEHAGLVGFLFLLVEPAGLVVRVELVIGIEQLFISPVQLLFCKNLTIGLHGPNGRLP